MSRLVNSKFLFWYCDCSKIYFVLLGSGFQGLVSVVGLYLVSFRVAIKLHIICIWYYIGDFHVASIFVVSG